MWVGYLLGGPSQRCGLWSHGPPYRWNKHTASQGLRVCVGVGGEAEHNTQTYVVSCLLECVCAPDSLTGLHACLMVVSVSVQSM